MTTGRDPRLTQEQKRRISGVRNVGNGGWRDLYMTDTVLTKIIALIEADHAEAPTLASLPDGARAEVPLFDIPVQWFWEEIDVPDFVEVYLEAEVAIHDFGVLFESMSEIVKRRARVAVIIASQAFTAPDRIAHRAVLERGVMSDRALPSQMMWRKLLYDIDNRVSAEAGYLNEAIFANALGGCAYAPGVSPVLRDGDGAGRQIDCIVDDVAYEIKSRVTDAASGRARMNDELALPRDCRLSGYRPWLLVFDDTPGDHRDRITDAYVAEGGEALFGDAAWAHILANAGSNMTRLLERYFRSSRDVCLDHPCLPLDVTLKARDDELVMIYTDPDTAQDYRHSVARSPARKA